jgi:glutamine cyclotransferase
VDPLNELEWVKGEIYANIWKEDRIACINPQTGKIQMDRPARDRAVRRAARRR